MAEALAANSTGKMNPASVAQPRLYGLDWLRAIAAVLVVLLHAAIPYMTNPLPGLYWSILPNDQSASVNVIGWWINGFVMPVFFLMNGYLSARLLSQRGITKFIKHRFWRIGGPLLFGIAVIIPIDLYIWLFGWFNADLITMRQIRALKIGGELGPALHGFSHLWFLQAVLLYCLVAAVISACWNRFQSTRSQVPKSSWSLSFAGHTWPALLIGIVVGGAILWVHPRIVIGFRHHWHPAWENLVYYAVPFCLGWFWDRGPLQVPQVRGQWAGRMVLAMLVFAVMWPGLIAHLNNETIPASRAEVPYLFAAFGLIMSTGLFGAALTWRVEHAPAVISYLSKASFWIYLFHHPVVALMQVDLVPLPISALAKFLLTSVVGLGFCLLTYEGLVRRTWLGQLLNGSRDQRRVQLLPVTEQGDAVERVAA